MSDNESVDSDILERLTSVRASSSNSKPTSKKNYYFEYFANFDKAKPSYRAKYKKVRKFQKNVQMSSPLTSDDESDGTLDSVSFGSGASGFEDMELGSKEEILLCEQLLSVIHDPIAAKMIIDTAILIDPALHFLGTIDSVPLRNAIISMLPQEKFEYVLNKYGRILTDKCVAVLPTEKLQIWAENVDAEVVILKAQLSLLKYLVTNNLIKETDDSGFDNIETRILHTFTSGLGRMRSFSYDRQEYAEMLEYLLMYFDGKYDYTAFTACEQDLFPVICKYYTNKCFMLELECKTKDRYIEDLIKPQNEVSQNEN
jgi:hypothetical protein